jgi:serine protease
MTRKALTIGTLILGCLAVLSSPPVSGVPARAQEREAPAPGTRIALHDGLPAIDRGLHAERLGFTSRFDLASADAGGALPYEPGQVIVKYRSGLTTGALTSVAASVGAVQTTPLSYANFEVLKIDDGADPIAVADALNQRPEVEYAQPAYRLELHWTPNDPMYAQQWNFPAIDMERAWDINRGASSDVTVAVLDSGIAFKDIVLRFNTRPITVFGPGGIQVIDHGTIDVPFAAAPDLAGPDRFVAPFDFTWNDVYPVDTLGHGTHVAGTIGQLTNNGVGGAGMAFNVKLMPVKVAAGGNWDFVFGAPGASFTDAQTARAIRYAADNGAKVLNMSFGRRGAPAPVIEDAIRYAVSKGAFCVISAGNGGNAFITPSPLEVIADIASRVDGAVAVAAVGRNLDRAPYSSRGPWIEIAAPGGDVSIGSGLTGGILQQTLDGSFFASPFNRPRFDAIIYQYSQGTSMAAPHVSGFAALLIQQGITKPAAIEAAMKRFATDRGSAGRDDDYGAGVINPRATLRGLGLAR